MVPFHCLSTVKYSIFFPPVCVQEERGGLRPRLCHMKKGAGGYGFNLHSEKSKPGQFIRAVDKDSPAQRADLRPQDKIIQVPNTQAHTATLFILFLIGESFV